ncbi:MAG: leucine-rich repeat domain-containing protein [Ruminococcaceae bacterium]|nr:leucine-rich repeat domain-containing protein [Oscillospiraceae bacterium]
MKLKCLVLFVLVAAMLFAVSCGKKQGETSDDSGKESIVIPEGLNFAPIEGSDFYVLVEGQHYEGEELVIPSVNADGKMVTQIGTFGFYKLTNLKKVTIPSTVEIINASAFEGCTSLTDIVFPNSVERIFLSAFEGCTALTSVTIPNSVFSIGSDAFKGCTALAEITYQGTVEQWQAFERFRSSTWIDENKSITVHCTDGDLVEMR